MTFAADSRRLSPIHPFHAAVLAGAFPLFLGTLLVDWAYYASHEVQWADFGSWLVIGAMVFATVALACAAIGLFRGNGGFAYVLALAATWVLGFGDALHHARDAWAVMPGVLWLSMFAALSSLLALCMGMASWRAGGVR